jgi:O-methyltransferase
MNDAEIVAFVKPYTAISNERIFNVLSLVERVVQENIPGDLAEVGVWKGGAVMAMALKCKQLGVSRPIHLYDTFTGMTEPTAADVDLNDYRAKDMFEAVKCEAGIGEVARNLAKVEYSNFVYHIGDITKADTKSFPEFALLRLDTDWYESTKFELTYMEPRVSPNGFIIVDDYGHWKGSRKAVDEHRPHNLQTIDYTGVWWRKDYGRSILESLPKTEYTQLLLENFHHFVALGPGFHGGCGSYMFDGRRYVYQAETLKKQEALFEVGKKSTRVLEVGVYLGHSLLILLLSNPTLKIVCIDNDPQFSPRAVEYLNKHFDNRIEFHLGDSVTVLSRPTRLGLFDCIHIDADHQEAPVRREFELTKPLAKSNAYFVFDDYEALQRLIDGWIQSGELLRVETPYCLWTNIITRLNSESS